MGSTDNRELDTVKKPEMKRRIVYLTRIETFSAAHRLHSPHLTEEENSTYYELCNNPNGHGHNYKVEVTLKGEVDPITGMILRVSDLKAYMKKAFVEPMDHKHIDLDVEYFRDSDVTSTTENLAIFIWSQMKAVLPDPSLLYEVKIHGTDKNIMAYRGE